jgi:hypothetical protein
MTVSRNTPTLSRRTALAGIAAACAANATTGTAKAASGDAKLVDLGRELDALAIKMQEAYERCSPLQEQAWASRPPFLDAMEATRNDTGYYGFPRPGDRRHPYFYTTFDLEDLRRLNPTHVELVPLAEAHKVNFSHGTRLALYSTEQRAFVKHVPWPEAQARVRQIIAAIEQWQRLRDENETRYGLDEAQKELDALLDRKTELFEAIMATPATSYAGLLVKAKAVKVIHCDEDEIDIGDATNHRLASSLLNDMLAGAVTG